MKSSRPGFTLIEVVVALGIAAGSLLLLLSASRASLQRGLRGQEKVQVETALESIKDEIVLGLELSRGGDLPGAPGFTWRAEWIPENDGELPCLERVSLSAFPPGGERAIITMVFLRRMGGGRAK